MSVRYREQTRSNTLLSILRTVFNWVSVCVFRSNKRVQTCHACATCHVFCFLYTLRNRCDVTCSNFDIYTRFNAMVKSISTGEAFVTHRKGSIGLLGDNTCRAIARIACSTMVHGQWNPLCGSIMLRRGESKRYFSSVVVICI